MKVHDILENVVKGNFGNQNKSNIEIPKGYSSFSVKIHKNGKSADIIGKKENGKEEVISTVSSVEAANALAKEYNSGGFGGTGIKQLSLTQAFGSELLNVLDDFKIKILEKPSYMSDIRNNTGISEIELAKIKRYIDLPEYDVDDVYGYDYSDVDVEEEFFPQMDIVNKPKEQSFILNFPDTNNKYLVDMTGAKSYIRNWAYLKS